MHTRTIRLEADLKALAPIVGSVLAERQLGPTARHGLRHLIDFHSTGAEVEVASRVGDFRDEFLTDLLNSTLRLSQRRRPGTTTMRPSRWNAFVAPCPTATRTTALRPLSRQTKNGGVTHAPGPDKRVD
jgi:hypothetical protein